MRVLIFTAAIFIAFQLPAQDHFCGSTEAQNKWFAEHPELKARFDALQRQAEAQDKAFFNNKNAQQRTASTTSAANYTIPVVFHILHTGGAENITDTQVLDAVSILNRDYRKLNPDTNVVVSAFQQLIGDVKIQFGLATKDPNGNCTNGIVRHYDVNTDWQGSFSNYAYTWDPTEYMNVYVVRTMGGGAAGYTYLPGTGIPASMDAIVILSSYVGSIGSGNVSTSRALTHEVGHWFNLEHTWGNTNNPGVACGDDGVGDTPVTKGFSGCALNAAMICNPGVVENVQNYMDYSYCSRMFTIGQANRMQTAAGSFINSRDNLSTNANLVATGLINPSSGCLPDVNISIGALVSCSGRTLTLSSYTFNASPTTYAWSANNGATLINPTSPSPQIVLNNTGNTVVSCTVTNANGSNNTSTAINVLNGNTQVTGTSFESFENGLPAQWSIINATTPTVTWAITQDGAASGINSMFVAGENLPSNSIEILETPSYDFKNNPGAQFTFYYAYAKATAGNKDAFKVQASKDCGGTWTDVWTPFNSILANASAGVTSLTFSPTQSEWVQYNVGNAPQFFPFLNEDNVRIRFFFQEDVGGVGYGNRFYLDDINFSLPTGINELTKSVGFSVSPNPSQSSFHIRFTLAQTAMVKYQVLSVTGAVLMSEAEKPFATGNHEISINDNQQLSPGIYFLNFELNGVKMSRKLVVE